MIEAYKFTNVQSGDWHYSFDEDDGGSYDSLYWHRETVTLVEQQEPVALKDQLNDALDSLNFYKRRVEALQQWQSKMRDPERTIVCDIIANGCTLEPSGDRYKQPAQQSAERGEPVEKDAEEWGNRLNEASWAAVEAWDHDLMGPLSVGIFNNIKGVVRAAIMKYAEGYTSPPASKPLTDERAKELWDKSRCAIPRYLTFKELVEAEHGIKDSST